MGELYLDEIERRSVQEKCVHYWIIESPNSYKSSGICKLCGMTKEFFNDWEKGFNNSNLSSGAGKNPGTHQI